MTTEMASDEEVAVTYGEREKQIILTQYPAMNEALRVSTTSTQGI